MKRHFSFFKSSRNCT